MFNSCQIFVEHSALSWFYGTKAPLKEGFIGSKWSWDLGQFSLSTGPLVPDFFDVKSASINPCEPGGWWFSISKGAEGKCNGRQVMRIIQYGGSVLWTPLTNKERLNATDEPWTFWNIYLSNYLFNALILISHRSQCLSR